MKGIINLYLASSLLISPSLLFANTKNKIDSAIDVIQKLCLSGTEYGISADANGNISIKDFKPNGKGSLTINVHEAGGATALQKELRIIGDREVRECTQNHIGRVLDVLFSTTKSSINSERDNISTRKAKFVGYIPSEIAVVDFVDSDKPLYYRFTVKETSKIEIQIHDNSQQLTSAVITKNENVILREQYINSGKKFTPQLFTPGDYYIEVKPTMANTATPFRIVMLAN